jgi:hypothetical protein
MVTVGFLGLFIKLFRPSEANFLFDGASLILYVIGSAVYVANIVKGLRMVSSGLWHSPNWEEESHKDLNEGEIILGREDSLKVLSASNTILALILIGVLVLQAGQWYAERKEIDDDQKIEKEEERKEAEKKEASASGHRNSGASKKRQ